MLGITQTPYGLPPRPPSERARPPWAGLVGQTQVTAPYRCAIRQDRIPPTSRSWGWLGLGFGIGSYQYQSQANPKPNPNEVNPLFE
jgi:hypothetical protein